MPPLGHAFQYSARIFELVSWTRVEWGGGPEGLSAKHNRGRNCFHCFTLRVLLFFMAIGGRRFGASVWSFCDPSIHIEWQASALGLARGRANEAWTIVEVGFDLVALVVSDSSWRPAKVDAPSKFGLEIQPLISNFTTRPGGVRVRPPPAGPSGAAAWCQAAGAGQTVRASAKTAGPVLARLPDTKCALRLGPIVGLGGGSRSEFWNNINDCKLQQQ